MVRRMFAVALLALLPSLSVGAAEFQQTVDAEPGGTLRVRLGVGSVEVEPHGRSQVRVEAEARGAASSMHFRLSGDGRDTELVGDAGGGWWGLLLGSPNVRVRIRIPERYSVEIETGGGFIEVEDVRGSVVARTSGGRIELDGAEGPVDLRTSGGSIDAEEVNGELLARTSGGAIRISEAAGRVEARTSGGDLEILDVRGPVVARTSGGSISVRFTGVPEGSVETSGGSIEAEFPEDAGVNLDARTSGGRVEVERDVRVDGRVEPSRIEGDVNGGGPSLRLRTSGGNIRIRAR